MFVRHSKFHRKKYFQVYAGPSTYSDLLEKFCNTTHPEPLISPGNVLTLHFHSDESATDAGFQIHYSLIEGIQGCGGTFTSPHGEFGSPMENGQYQNNLNCYYLIKMPRNSRSPIKVKFLSFHLEGDGSCPFDYVEVRHSTIPINCTILIFFTLHFLIDL